MKTKKILAVIAIILLVFSAINARATYDISKAQTYLKNHGDNPWSIMALTVLGQIPASTTFLTSINGGNAIDYETPILAITALGENPRTFGSADYVSRLKSFYADGQIGNAETLNDDIFGILALVSAGEPLNDAAISETKNFILAHQNANGGWGFAISSDSDTNMTASAVLALLAAGISDSDSHIQNALSFLKNSQNNDGGFPYVSGALSDSSSTAWILWTLNALNINPADWSKSGNTPVSYLESNLSGEGFFKFQSDSGEDAFSATTTAYAVIALQGKSLPIHIEANGSPLKKFQFRIEGANSTVCSGETAGPTALDIIKNAKDLCGFNYEITNSSFGPYLSKINSDEASGMTGWMYMVNYLSPNTGAADYNLQDSDSVLWYFGGFDWKPLKLSLSSQKINSGENATADVEEFNNNLWSPLPNSIIHINSDTVNANSAGQATLTLKDGYYKIYAEKQGYIRSDAVTLEVGKASSSVGLNVNIVKPIENPENSVSFIVTPNTLDFGTLSPGSSSSKNINITNNGTTAIHIESTTAGDAIFTQNLNLNNTPWENFKTDITQGNSMDVSASLSVPADYAGQSGTKSGQLTVWAMAK